jgi:hypothetical protein
VSGRRAASSWWAAPPPTASDAPSRAPCPRAGCAALQLQLQARMVPAAGPCLARALCWPVHSA